MRLDVWFVDRIVRPLARALFGLGVLAIIVVLVMYLGGQRSFPGYGDSHVGIGTYLWEAALVTLAARVVYHLSIAYVQRRARVLKPGL